MNKEIWNNWKSNWEWILSIAKKRKWEIIDDLIIKPPVSLQEVRETEKQLNLTLPEEFVDVLTNYSSGVNFFFQIEGEETEGDYRQIFSAGYEQIWDFESLPDLKESYDGWLNECFNNPDDEYDRIWQHKVPFIHVATGDLIAFDVSNGTSGCPVVFLSHDGSDMHGKRLGYNFVDFITRWSNVGCFGPEDWQFEPFYDEEQDILLLDGPAVENWKDGFLNRGTLKIS